MKAANITKLLMGLFVAGMIIYDLVIYLSVGGEATISTVTWDIAHEYPILTFATGAVFGHILAPLYTGRPQWNSSTGSGSAPADKATSTSQTSSLGE
jgi:hypothetical protein